MAYKNLITLDEFGYLYNTGRTYRGFVCSPKEGRLYYSDVDYQTSIRNSPSLPHHNSLGYTNGTKFYDVKPTVELKIVDLERNDLIYDEKGDYIGLVEDDNNILGEIIIRRYKYFGYNWDQNSQQDWGYPKAETKENTPAPQYEYVKLGEITLTPEAYSKIFTHIISLMQEVKLETIKEGKVSIELQKKGMKNRKYYNKESKFYPDASYKTNASFRYDFVNGKNGKFMIVAIIYDHNSHMYETAWNVMNLLGAHEYMGHAIRGYNDNELTHQLAYLYQIGHNTWKHTTILYQENINSSLKGYYELYKSWAVPNNVYDKKLKEWKEFGVFPTSSKDESKFENKVSKTIQTNPFFQNTLREARWNDWINGKK